MTKAKGRRPDTGVKGLYYRGESIWLRYKDAGGRWRSRSSTFRRGEEAQAKALLDAYRLRIETEVEAEEDRPAMTVSEWFATWLERREQRGVKSTQRDGYRFGKHVLPVIGAMSLTSIRRRHVISVISRARETLAPRTVNTLASTLKSMFKDAVIDELLVTSPCVLRRGDLPPNEDADPLWRATAVFSADEVRQIVSDEAIPDDRRTLYALTALAGLRIGEALALRWEDLDETTAPLWRAIVHRSHGGTTKTGKARHVPVHASLRAVLERWRRMGFATLTGRRPMPSDVIVPDPSGERRNYKTTLRRFYRDLDACGVRRRRLHDLRRTFTSLARANGARADIIDAVTHDRAGSIVDVYTTWPWETLCQAVSCIDIEPPRRVRLAAVVGIAKPPKLDRSLQYLATVERKPAQLLALRADGRDMADPSTGRPSTPHEPPEEPRNPAEQGAQRSGHNLADAQADPPETLECSEFATAVRYSAELIEAGDIDEAVEVMRRVIRDLGR